MSAATLVALAACAAAHEASGPSNITFLTTWYGAKDNCPPGGAIAHPIIHKVAGGIGTYNDPITFAGVKEREAPGTIIYIAKLRKYFVMEDDCEECKHDWEKKQKYHIDLWQGPDTVLAGKGLIECENAMTSENTVTLNPPSNLYADITAVFSANRTANDGCIVPVQPCHDAGNQCGNSCEIPHSATCAQLAQLFALTIDRFEQLNPKLDCNNKVASGTSVCMGGTCGD